MSRRIGLSCIGLLAAALGISGCIIEVTFDPIGTDASIEGAWTIDDAAPTEESCAALGITHVRVRFFDGDDWVDHPDLVFDCAQGSFDTRPNAVVADGQWTIAMVAIDADGNTIAMGDTQTVDTLVVGGHIVLRPINFMAAGVTGLAGSWTINGAAPTQASCDELGATEVHVQFLDDAGELIPTETLKIPCANGSFLQEMEPGEYTARLALVDADSGVLAMEEEPHAITITEGMTANLPPVNFAAAFDPSGTDSVLKAAWLIGGSDALPADQCAAVGAASVELVFYAESDTGRENGVAFDLGPCDTGTYDSVATVLAAGSYMVDANLLDADDGIISEVDLGTVTVTADSTLTAGPIDFRLDQSVIYAQIEWEVPATPATYGSCAEAEVAAVNWQLRPAGSDTPVVMGTADETCTEYIEIDATGLAAGDYTLYYDGEEEDGSKNWRPAPSASAPCEGAFDGAAGGLAVLYCQAGYSP